MDIRTLQTALARIAEERAGDPLQAPKNLALSLAADAGILLSLFRGLAEQQNLQDDLAREAAADALTSIVVHCAQLANHIGMDASAALRARIKGRPAPPLAAIPPSEPLPPASAGSGPQPPASDPAPHPAAAEAAAAPAAAAPVRQQAAEQEPAVDRRRAGPEVIAIKVRPERAPRPSPASAAVEVVSFDDEPSPPEPAAAPTPAPAPAAAAAATPAPAPAAAPARADSPPAPEAHARLDAEQVLDLAKALIRLADRSTRDDPVLRDLRDELETLRRTLYASNAKKAWIAGSLKSVRGWLEESLAHGFAEEIRAAEFMARIDVLLAD